MLRLSSSFKTIPKIPSRTYASSSSGKGLANILQKNPDDVVVTLALRTPFCRSKKGALKDTTSDELLLGMLKAVVERSKVEPEMVEDIVVGKFHELWFFSLYSYILVHSRNMSSSISMLRGTSCCFNSWFPRHNPGSNNKPTLLIRFDGGSLCLGFYS